ncbi:alpha/beta fold hydrolase [Roseomonas marmotae]|uniref:Alpha/beta fold hydrolase n=1 Tax=Roseomonas marmotae TaxID=2768161 RepID=A0ABS3KBK4_9PROT|nr:alpha/beta fold hydrolase [Roseomonas marmotae]MBO1074028.1 alpha/beta fold hydrolase [Roseomonas marmotae]QTI78814.1 alpha/beta fold hydrolase [Roseomonas marmotae]
MTGPMLRRGPRPLPLHLSLAMTRAMAALTTLPPSGARSSNWNNGWPISKAGQAEASRIGAALAAGHHPPEAFHAAVRQRLAREDAAFIAGIAAYRRHPWLRQMPEAAVVWQEGGSRLLDYGGDGVPVLVVPSLVNRAHVLDLAPGHSMLRHLAEHGTRVLLLDWGWPGEVERGFGLTDYIAGRLERALASPAATALGSVALVGYCMGGLLALASALRRPDRVRGLALLATPWDFSAGGEEAAGRALGLAKLLPGLQPLMESTGTLPVDVVQWLFASLDPWSIARKFRAFARLDPQSPRAILFVALEDWLNDGVPLAAPVARECLGGWYGRNEPGLGQWRVAGAVVEPAALDLPAFAAIPQSDRIVPPASALALAERLPRAQIHMTPAGHIGMAAGGRAEAALWAPLLRWLMDL